VAADATFADAETTDNGAERGNVAKLRRRPARGAMRLEGNRHSISVLGRTAYCNQPSYTIREGAGENMSMVAASTSASATAITIDRRIRSTRPNRRQSGSLLMVAQRLEWVCSEIRERRINLNRDLFCVKKKNLTFNLYSRRGRARQFYYLARADRRRRSMFQAESLQ